MIDRPGEMVTSAERVCVDKDGNVTDCDGGDVVRVLVAAGDSLSAADAAKYGITPAQPEAPKSEVERHREAHARAVERGMLEEARVHFANLQAAEAAEKAAKPAENKARKSPPEDKGR